MKTSRVNGFFLFFLCIIFVIAAITLGKLSYWSIFGIAYLILFSFVGLLASMKKARIHIRH